MYLGCTVTYNYHDCMSMYRNLQKLQQRWVIVGKVMSKTGMIVRAQGMMYKAFIQLLFLYGNDSWVLTGGMLKVV